MLETRPQTQKHIYGCLSSPDLDVKASTPLHLISQKILISPARNVSWLRAVTVACKCKCIGLPSTSRHEDLLPDNLGTLGGSVPS